MPSKLVRQLFFEFFQVDQFEINEITSQMVANCTAFELKKRINNQQDLSRLISKCEFYDYRAFNSLSKIFNVSIEAMAIRLEELKLIRYK